MQLDRKRTRAIAYGAEAPVLVSIPQLGIILQSGHLVAVKITQPGGFPALMQDRHTDSHEVLECDPLLLAQRRRPWIAVVRQERVHGQEIRGDRYPPAIGREPKRDMVIGRCIDRRIE